MSEPDWRQLLRDLVEAWDAYEPEELHGRWCGFSDGHVRKPCDCGFAEMERQVYVARMLLRTHGETVPDEEVRG